MNAINYNAFGIGFLITLEISYYCRDSPLLAFSFAVPWERYPSLARAHHFGGALPAVTLGGGLGNLDVPIEKKTEVVAFLDCLPLADAI